MNEIKDYTEKIFEDRKHIDEADNEYWDARELMSVLQYNLWQNFHKITLCTRLLVVNDV